MAQVATVYSVAPWVRSAGAILHGLRDPKIEEKRPKPHDKRVCASVEKTPRATIREMFDEALGRDPQKERRWVVLVDGEPKQLRAVKAEARRVGVEITLIVDIVHVLEYLWKAARALFDATSPKAEAGSAIACWRCCRARVLRRRSHFVKTTCSALSEETCSAHL